MVPYSGKQGHQLLSKMKKQVKRTLPNDIKTLISYKSTKFSTKFLVKNETDFQHRENVVNHGKCPSERGIVERMKDHNSKHNSSHLLKHARENGHTHVWEKDFEMLGNNYQSNFKQKIG